MASLRIACRVRALLSSLLVFGAAATFAQSGPPPGVGPAPSEPTAAASRYIVVFKAHVTNPAAEAARALAAAGPGAVHHHTYTHAIRGFAATLPAAAVQHLRSNPNVRYIEQDRPVGTSYLQSPATWGLDRIDQVDRPLDASYEFTHTGQGVYAFVVDSGIRADHVEFGGRVLPGVSFVNNSPTTEDCHGHGTHVSGTLGGTTWGVAKQVWLVPVRVLDCAASGFASLTIAGLDWVLQSPLRPGVVNLSLIGTTMAVNDAVESAVSQGLTVVVGAGNDSADACAYSPSSAASAITVGASNTDDEQAYFSNHGPCLDLFAPGTDITSAGHLSATATRVMNGTSMAAPHVAGMAALILQGNPTASPAAVTAAILNHASPNKISLTGPGSPLLLAHSPPAGFGVVDEPPVQAVAVSAMSGQGVAEAKNRWHAQVVVTVYDPDTAAPVAGATVSGQFAGSTAATCHTFSDGRCTLSSGSLKSSKSYVDFSVTELSGTSMQYLPAANAVTTVRVNKP